MRNFDTAADLLPFVGQPLGTSDWIAIEQPMLDAFAELTGDHQWIHVDVERAAHERPDGRTICHGYLLTALLPRMRVFEISRYAFGLNYGSDRIRFIGPVPTGSRIRQHMTLAACDRIDGGYRVKIRGEVEVEGRERRALVAETIALYYDPA